MTVEGIKRGLRRGKYALGLGLLAAVVTWLEADLLFGVGPLEPTLMIYTFIFGLAYSITILLDWSGENVA